MLEQFYSAITQYIDTWGYTAIFIGMTLESACLPIPSELIFGFVGYLVFQGQMDFTTAVVSGVAGGLCGSILAYGIGHYGGQPFIDKYGKLFFLSKRHVAVAQRWFDRYGIAATFFGRLLPVVRTFISLPAGFAKVPFVKFVTYTILGSVPWTIGLIYGGMLLGENWHKLDAVGHNVSLLIVACLIIVGILWLRHGKEEINPD